MRYSADTIEPQTATVVRRTVGVIIRRARVEDMYSILALGRAMHDESVFRHLPFEAEHVRTVVMNCITRDDHFGMIAEDDGELVAMMGGYLTYFISCKQRLAQDLSLFVRSDRRGTVAAVKLIKAFLDWAKKNGAVETVCGVTAPPPEQRERVFELYKRLGFEEAGRLFRMRS